jgi:hypothetical protein
MLPINVSISSSFIGFSSNITEVLLGLKCVLRSIKSSVENVAHIPDGSACIVSADFVFDTNDIKS